MNGLFQRYNEQYVGEKYIKLTCSNPVYFSHFRLIYSDQDILFK